MVTLDMLIAAPRTGSSFLTQLLMAHPDILHTGELFGVSQHVRLPCAEHLSAEASASLCIPKDIFDARHDNITSAAACIRSLAGLASASGKKVAGLKLMPYQLLRSKTAIGTTGQLATLFLLLPEHRVRLITLERMNKLAEFVSGQVALKDPRCFHQLDCRNESVGVVDSAAFRSFVAKQKEYYHMVDTEAARAHKLRPSLDLRVMHLKYEYDILVNATAVEATLRRVFRFLGVTAYPQLIADAVSRHLAFRESAPTNGTVLQQRISNWEQLRRAVAPDALGETKRIG